MTACRNTCRLLALFGVGVFGLLTLVGSGGGGGDGGGSTPAPTPKSWGTALLIETDNAGDATVPQIAVNGSGVAFAVWLQGDGMSINVLANRFSAGAWGAAEIIDTLDADAFQPQIAVDGIGNAIAVWVQNDGFSFSILAARYSNGAWGMPVPIDNVAGPAFEPQIAMDSGGNAFAVWQQFDGSTDSIYANQYIAGAWGTAQLIETTAGFAREPQVAVDGSGNAIAVWFQSDGLIPAHFNLWANRFSAGAWEGEESIENDDAGDAVDPQIAMDGSGNAFAVWVRVADVGGRSSIWANRTIAGAWGTPELLETDDAQNARDPQIAVDGSGNAIAVWAQIDITLDQNIYANRFNAGTGMWGAAQLIETNAGDAFDPQIAADGSGNALVVWRQFESISMVRSIWANRFSAGMSMWETAQLIETDDAGDALAPQIAVDGSGDALALWQQAVTPDIGARTDIWANRFD